MVNVRRNELLLLCLLQIEQLTYLKAYEIENFANDKGWKPMRREEFYNGSPDYMPTANQMRNDDYSPKYADDIENIDELKSEVIKLVKPYKIYSEFSKTTNNMKEDFAEISGNNQRILQDKESHDVIKIPPSNRLENKTRTAKTISDRNLSKFFIKQFENKRKNDTINRNDEEKDKHLLIKSASEKNATTYAVSENSEEGQDFFKADQAFSHNAGYFYNLPTYNQLNEEKTKLSPKIMNILSKYKISGADYSRNYELSRNTNLRNYFKPELVFLPVPHTALDHYNSLNHLPVIPLLAAFLSNYGYYLPGLYGLQNQFKNLYGYLASNNIHNNKPFGPYKVFSDTDSSNK